ncbi:scavenger receptor class B member 1-like isoform X1 [Poecilia latipinna]|nr:PREDICTED: scavenger receptor class B member 1-like isoform X1 [Poecilia latipinna]
MKRISGIIETGKISEVVMPMLWFEENGYIDGPILTTFHTNLVILPAVMEYMQYIFIALGLLTTIVAALVYYKVRRKTCEGDALPRENTSTSSHERTPLLQDEQH